MKCTKLAPRVLEAYAHDLAGLTSDDAARLIASDCLQDGANLAAAHSTLVDCLGRGGAGLLTGVEQQGLQRAGYSDVFIAGLAGDDGALALRLRTEWLGKKAIRGLFGLNPKERVLVIQELADIGEPALVAVDSLIKALDDPNPFVRPAAAQALGELRATVAIPALTAKLATWQGGERVLLIEALAKISAVLTPLEYQETILPSLRQCLRHDDSWPVQVAAGQAIGEMAASSAPAVGDLISALSDPEWWVRQRAAWALGQMGEVAADLDADGDEQPDAVQALIQCLRAWDAADRRVVRVALACIGRPAVMPLVLVMVGLTEPLWARREAAVVLGEIGDPGSVNYLVAGLADVDPEIEAAVQAALLRLGEQAVYELAQALEGVGRKPEGARSAAALLITLGLDHVLAVDALAARLGHKDALVCTLVVETIGAIGAEAEGEIKAKVLTLVPRLVVMLAQDRADLPEDEAWQIRMSVARALGEMRASDDATVDALVLAASTWPEDRARHPADALVRLGAAAVPKVYAACQESSRQEFLLDTLVRIGAAAVDGLIHLANLPRDLGKKALARLKSLPPEVFFPPLAQALKDHPEDATPRLKDVILGFGGAGVESLTLLLQGDVVENARFACEVLGELGPIADDARPALLGVLANPALSSAYDSAQTALERVGPPDIPDLITALSSPAKPLRAYATDALTHTGMPAVPALIAALDDTRPHVVTHAMGILSSLGTPVLYSLVRAAQRASAAVRERIAYVISNLEPLPLDALARAAEQEDVPEEQRVNAVWLIGELREKAVTLLPRLFALLGAKLTALSQAVEGACSKIGPPGTPAETQVLKPWLSHSEDATRAAAQRIFADWEVAP